MRVKEIEFETENPDETFVVKATGTSLEVWFKKVETGTESPIGDGITEQEITVTRTFVTKFEKP